MSFAPGHVADWVSTTLTLSAWHGFGRGTEFLNHRMEYAAEAIRAADPAVDFGRFDNDGPDGVPNSGDDDGIVDHGVALLYIETNNQCTGAVPAVNPVASTHRFSSPNRQPIPLATNDKTPFGNPIRVERFSVSSAVDCSGSRAAGIAVLGHELGHQMLELPDIYVPIDVRLPPTDGRIWILGCFEIMAAGSGWGCGVGANGHAMPTLFSRGLAKKSDGWIPKTSEQFTTRSLCCNQPHSEATPFGYRSFKAT